MALLAVAPLVPLALGESAAELAAHTFEGHTPSSTQWEVVHLNAVSGQKDLDSAWLSGQTGSSAACQAACGANTTCTAFAWAGTVSMPKHNCGFKSDCFFRSDLIWEPKPLTGCNFTSGRKIALWPTPPPTPPPTPLPPPQPPLGFQPNIVFILTDDQDTRLGRDDYTDIGSLEVMPKLQQHLVQGGARFRNAFVNTPICCPSRTEFFSGRYFHNVGPPNDPGSCMHADTTQAARNDTGLFGLMKRAGYQVGVFGKVTNDAGTILKLLSSERSASWINSPVDYNNYDGLPYWRYDDSSGAAPHTETLDKAKPVYGTVYQTVQLGNRTLDWLDALHERRRQRTGGDEPFFAYVGPHAPHYPAQPAPWYEHAFDGVTIPLTPNYNTSHEGKAQHTAQNPPLTARARCWQDQHFRDRWSSLLSVDDLVEAIVDKLTAQGVLDKTFIFYSSDHGYKQGQWRIGTSKEHPYETDIRVPLLVAGPGVAAGSTPEQMVGNVDVAPTILSLAGVTPPTFMDGRSMLPLLLPELPDPARRGPGASRAAAPWRTEFLNEYYSVGTYYNDHSSAWQDGKTTTDACGGAMPRGPAGAVKDCKESTGVGDGNCYFVDSTHSNSWRALRIIDGAAQRNWQYIEYDPAWQWNATGPTGAGLQHYELYDIDADPYQMNNMYPAANDTVKTELHGRLAAYYACGGSKTTQSNCI